MKFNLNRKKSFQIIKDKIATEFGFGTKKDRLDYKIDHYEENRISQNEQAIAIRQISISSVENGLREIKIVLDSYDKFIKYYDDMISLAEKDITRDDSIIKFKLWNPNQEVIAIENYKMLDIIAHLKKHNNIIVFLVSQLEKILNVGPKKLIIEIINAKGNYSAPSSKDIYHYFCLAQQMLHLGEIKGLNANLNSFEEMEIIAEHILARKRELSLIYNELSCELDQLQKLTANNRSQLDEIEKIKALMKSSEEYFQAKASHDYLEEFGRK